MQDDYKNLNFSYSFEACGSINGEDTLSLKAVVESNDTYWYFTIPTTIGGQQVDLKVSLYINPEVLEQLLERARLQREDDIKKGLQLA